MRIINIRARRPKPGMMPQHLKAVEAAAAVCHARVDGATPRSQTVRFEPASIRGGDFVFDIGTAGSTALVLQTILLPLCGAAAPSSVTVTGGTHVPWSPSFHYLDLHWRHYLRAIGFDVSLTMDLAGFYPRGGGRVRATVRPTPERAPLRLTRRGALRHIRGLSAVANLDLRIAERQRQQALRRLGRPADIDVVSMPARSRGTMLLLLAEFEHSQCCYFALGAPGKLAEVVADEAVDALQAFLATDGAVDQHLADQLIVPLALAPGVSEVRTSKVTQHLLTNADVVRRFIERRIEVEGAIGQPGLVRIAEG
jgi:RNA 3'-terminal phosphate cyclase (ATP)